MTDTSTSTARKLFVEAIRQYSEERWAAGWYSGVEKIVREKGGHWIGYAIAADGWPTGYPEDGLPWDPVTPDELREYEALNSAGIEYAIQVPFPDTESWTFVTTGHPGGNRMIETYSSLDDANSSAAVWGQSRVVARVVSDWMEVVQP